MKMDRAPSTSYDIQTCSRHCVRTGKELKPGERFFSVLHDRDGSLVREDISQEAWQGPPADAFSFWLSRVPAKDRPKRLQVDEEVLLDCFCRLAEEAESQKVNFRYILALLLMRRKRLKFDDARTQNGQEHLILRCTKTRNLHTVVNPQLTEPQLAEVQEEVRKIFDF